MSEQRQLNWDEDDRQLDEEFADVVQLVGAHKVEPVAPARLRRQVREIAKNRLGDALEDNWFLGQGPRVILVTLIVFAVAMWVLLIR